jgi:ribosomal protein S18 acetylase RimI-like enzyme
MKIRKARLEDSPQIVSLWKEMISHHNVFRTSKFERMKPEAHNNFRKFVISNIRSRNGLVLVAEDKGKLVGYSLNYIRKNIPIFRIGKMGYLSDLYVKERHRGAGIASMFKDAAFRWFREKGLRHASVEVYFENKASWSIYRKWGFEENHVRLIRKI